MGVDADVDVDVDNGSSGTAGESGDPERDS